MNIGNDAVEVIASVIQEGFCVKNLIIIVIVQRSENKAEALVVADDVDGGVHRGGEGADAVHVSPLTVGATAFDEDTSCADHRIGRFSLIFGKKVVDRQHLEVIRIVGDVLGGDALQQHVELLRAEELEAHGAEQAVAVALRLDDARVDCARQFVVITFVVVEEFRQFVRVQRFL